ncbi:MAG: glycerophosphodiester phosphodiesterase [Gemmatimonadota bacterium]
MSDRSRWRTLALSAAGVAVGGGIALARAVRLVPRPGSPYLAGAPLLIAHRGGAKLAPENTLLAFERALSWWRADILELDVQPTRDGEVVVFHDATLDRTTDGTGAVAAHSLEELRRLDAGYRFTPDGGTSFPFRARGIGVPTLREVLEAFPATRVNVEIKDGRVQQRVWDVVRDSRAVDRVLIAAGRRRDRSRLDGYPLPVSAGKEELRLFIAQLRLGLVLYVPPVDAFQVPHFWENREIATAELVRAARSHNIPVHVWTVDEIEEMRRLLDRGVDGIVTDRPDRLARLLHERVSRPLPPGPPDPVPEAFLEPLLLA